VVRFRKSVGESYAPPFPDVAFCSQAKHSSRLRVLMPGSLWLRGNGYYSELSVSLFGICDGEGCYCCGATGYALLRLRMKSPQRVLV